ncbi:MAG: DUF5685 family protein [Eubacteriales bacterium]|jgi:hypothetical protein
MFGYIKPFVPQLRVCEHECWRAVYCGLCKCMGKHVCADSTLTLTYDAAFLALVRLAATGEKTDFELRRCILHPLKKRLVLKQCEALRFSASVGALLAYHKIADDIADEGGLRGRLLLPEAKRLRRKAGYRELDEEITAKLEALYSAERKARETHSASPDGLAELSGDVTACIFAYGLQDRAARVVAELGRRVGRWVYIADAFADYEKDFKASNFNPFLFSPSQPVGDAGTRKGDMPPLDHDAVAASLALERRAAEAALNLLDCTDAGIESILRNIITLGMGSVEEKLLGSAGAQPQS